jgi:hypothetical protein
MYKALKDTNTGLVYDWGRKLENNDYEWVNIPSTMWKKEQEWTDSEISALFSPSSETIELSFDEPTEDEPDNSVDVQPDFLSEQENQIS